MDILLDIVINRPEYEKFRWSGQQQPRPLQRQTGDGEDDDGDDDGADDEADVDVANEMQPHIVARKLLQPQLKEFEQNGGDEEAEVAVAEQREQQPLLRRREHVLQQLSGDGYDEGGGDDVHCDDVVDERWLVHQEK